MEGGRGVKVRRKEKREGEEGAETEEVRKRLYTYSVHDKRG